ncbi:toprim domain-containing protein [Bacillus licheniformis]|uniref:toprim domain-containing protein n=1 Tax=Bacillus licheniformis TaxID=1402 RepID=UPI00209BA46A|nr:toprim domain-containing protein [Bacillus licheniformis]
MLAFLREETEEETVEYLIDAYAPESEDGKLTLRLPKLKIAKNREPLSESILDDVVAGPNDYLNKRGIMPAVQRLMGVGMAGGAVALPWWLPNGRLANVKYRSTRGKAFWYVKGGWPIRDLVYGMNVVYDRRLNRVVLCEAEIDAQSWMTAGVPAIGTGGSSFNQRKADIIVQSPIDHVTIVTDNDKAGEKLRAEVERYLYGKVGLAHGYITEGKDANELLLAKGRAELKAVYERADDVKKWRAELPKRVSFSLTGDT